MIASLPMYTFDVAANNAVWTKVSEVLIACGLQETPADLTVPDDLSDHWRSPDLLISQTCGYPLVTNLVGRVRVIGTFRYLAPGCDGARYRSFIIVRANDSAGGIEDLRGRRVAYNSPDSQSGYNSLRALVAPLALDGRFFGSGVATGAHMASMRAVASGAADVAAIDCVSFAGFCDQDGQLAASLKVIGETASAPGLPVITRGSATDAEVAILREALSQVVRDPEQSAILGRLKIGGFIPLDVADYGDIKRMERQAVDAGYPTLS